jgi:CO/xanthine dehydrogenase Mo-binding subunit
MTFGAFVMERVLDLLADRMGLDPAEIRRRNLIPAEAYPSPPRPASCTTAVTFRAHWPMRSPSPGTAGSAPSRRPRVGEGG